VIEVRVVVRVANADDDDDRSLLDDEERKRADAFRLDRDRHAFTIAHATLRRSLTERFGRSAREWAFGRQALGRPFVLDPPAGRDPRFSLSHTDGLIAVAVTEGAEVGVDVERIVPSRVDMDNLDAYLATEEAETVRRAPASERAGLFFAYWTAREALLKARGVGLTLRTECLALSFPPDRARRLDPILAPGGDWRFLRASPTPDHALAVVVDVPFGKDVDIRVRR